MIHTDKLPRWKCHKIVRAAKIIDAQESEGGYILTLDIFDEQLSVPVPAEVFARGKPEIGAYLVVYDDEYISWSPSKAFEDGYSRLPNVGAT